jgi:putative flippase GtrA
MQLLKKIVDPTFIRFLIVGVINTLVGTAVMFLLYNAAGLHAWGRVGYWLSTIGNYTVGSVVSFFLNKHYTFKSKEKGKAVVIRFVINIAVCMILAYGVAQKAVEWALSGTFLSEQMRGNLSMLVGMGLFVILNYLGQRFFAFRK